MTRLQGIVYPDASVMELQVFLVVVWRLITYQRRLSPVLKAIHSHHSKTPFKGKRIVIHIRGVLSCVPLIQPQGHQGGSAASIASQHPHTNTHHSYMPPALNTQDTSTLHTLMYNITCCGVASLCVSAHRHSFQDNPRAMQ
ncbi:hypothetical protein E2C01_004391 [Portunus trituberculatus]|uniref:Uncharacterized protein n=1 Tax=Portunus trituberculatus TaxID=210409 RepID=A0A5B7CPR4_PORTR|nr:hypothetical protein [Portunus trituberculatus]